ncbi:MAG: MBL fold metallo-hydrolase [Candidatus Hodarchaeales archaeon]
MAQSKVEAVKSLYSLELEDNETAFIFLGYGGILLRSNGLAVAFDPGKSLTQPEVSAIEHLNLLFYTHNHWDHYNNGVALQIIDLTGTHVVADPISSEELKASVPVDKITTGNSGSFATTYTIGDHEVIALRGIHVGPISQYLVNLGGLKVFHGGDSGFWRHKDIIADITFVPVGTARTCSPEVALAMVTNLQPKFAVPIHGKKQEMKQFKLLMEKVKPDIEVIIAEKFKLISFQVSR